MEKMRMEEIAWVLWVKREGMRFTSEEISRNLSNKLTQLGITISEIKAFIAILLKEAYEISVITRHTISESRRNEIALIIWKLERKGDRLPSPEAYKKELGNFAVLIGIEGSEMKEFDRLIMEENFTSSLC